jgi:hypothetical protein
VAKRLIVLPPMLEQREPIMTPAEIEGRRVIALRLFDALCAHYPDKYVALIIQPRDVVDDEPDDVTVPRTAG